MTMTMKLIPATEAVRLMPNAVSSTRYSASLIGQRCSRMTLMRLTKRDLSVGRLRGFGIRRCAARTGPPANVSPDLEAQLGPGSQAEVQSAIAAERRRGLSKSLIAAVASAWLQPVTLQGWRVHKLVANRFGDRSGEKSITSRFWHGVRALYPGGGSPWLGS